MIAKALDKSPDRRFPTCTDLVNAARGVIDAAGPLDTSAPRTAREPGESGVTGSATNREVGEAIEGMRESPRRPAGRACCSAASTPTRAP